MASGTFDEKSDIDLLVLGKKSDVDDERVLDLERIAGHQIQLTIIPWHRFETMKTTRDPFTDSLIENHILIRGASL